MNNTSTEHKRSARVDLKVLAAVSAFASTEETRYYLNGVCVELEPKSTTYVATDGHRLMVYRDDVFADDAVNTLTGHFIIPTAQCRALKVAKDFALAKLEQEAGSSFLTIDYADLGLTFKPVDGTFPDWRRVMPVEKASGAPGHFNLDYLASFSKFAKTLGFSTPYIAHNGGEQPSRVRFDEDFACGVIMPMRVEHRDDAPAWLKAA